MEEVRQLVQEEGREARNLVAFHVSVDTPARVSRKPPRATPPPPRRAAPRATRLRSASAGRDKRDELRARYWALLFGDLQRAVGEIYNTVEAHENLNECQEVILVLENYLRDFKALAEWFRLKWEYDNTPPPQRPQSLAWEIRKTDFVRPESRRAYSVRSSPSVSGKNSPCLSGNNTPSGKNSPNLTGKTSPGSGKISPRIQGITSPKANIEFFSSKITSKVTTKPEPKSAKDNRLSDIKEKDVKDTKDIEDSQVSNTPKNMDNIKEESKESGPIESSLPVIVEIGKAKEVSNTLPKPVIIKSSKRKQISNGTGECKPPATVSEQVKITIEKLDSMENEYLAQNISNAAIMNENLLNRERDETVTKAGPDAKVSDLSETKDELQSSTESPVKSEDNFADVSNDSSHQNGEELTNQDNANQCNDNVNLTQTDSQFQRPAVDSQCVLPDSSIQISDKKDNSTAKVKEHHVDTDSSMNLHGEVISVESAIIEIPNTEIKNESEVVIKNSSSSKKPCTEPASDTNSTNDVLHKIDHIHESYSIKDDKNAVDSSTKDDHSDPEFKRPELKDDKKDFDLKKNDVKTTDQKSVRPAYSQAAAKPKLVTAAKNDTKPPAKFVTPIFRSKTVVEMRSASLTTKPTQRQFPKKNQARCSYPFNLTTGRSSLFDTTPSNRGAVQKRPVRNTQMAAGDNKAIVTKPDTKKRPPRPVSLKINEKGDKKDISESNLEKIKDCEDYSSTDTIVTQIDMSRIESSESLKTLVPDEILSQDVANSIEVLNLDNNKSDNEGWLTVKSRRFSRESKKQSKSHWSQRFHQPSATTSLPTLNMLESPKQENNPVLNSCKVAKTDRAKSEQPEKVVKVSPKAKVEAKTDSNAGHVNNTMIRQKSDVTGLRTRSSRNRAMSKKNDKSKKEHKSDLTTNRRHSSLESLTTGLERSQETTEDAFDFDKWKEEFKSTFKYLEDDDQMHNNEILKSADPSEMSEIAEMTSQIEENEKKISWALDLQSDLDQRKLCEEEDSLNRQIMELQQVSDIDLDTETDDTETDAEIHVDDNVPRSKSPDQLGSLAASLEDQYETALAGMSWAERVDTLVVLEALVARDPGRAQQLHAKLSQGIKRRGSLQDALRRLQAKQARAERQRQEYQTERAKKIHQLLARVEEVKVAKTQLIEEKRMRMERRLQKAAENRDQRLKDIVRKAHDEEEKLREIAFIKQLEAENRRHEFLDQCRSHTSRLRLMRRDRLDKLEQKAARDAAVGARRQALEAARKQHVESLLEKRKERDARVEELKEQKRQERDDAAREKAEGVKSRLSALAAAAELEADALKARIRDKQDASQQRLESHLQAIREKATGPRQQTISESQDQSNELEEEAMRLEQERKERDKLKSIKKRARKVRQKIISTGNDPDLLEHDYGEFDSYCFGTNLKTYRVLSQIRDIIEPMVQIINREENSLKTPVNNVFSELVNARNLPPLNNNVRTNPSNHISNLLDELDLDSDTEHCAKKSKTKNKRIEDKGDLNKIVNGHSLENNETLDFGVGNNTIKVSLTSQVPKNISDFKTTPKPENKENHIHSKDTDVKEIKKKNKKNKNNSENKSTNSNVIEVNGSKPENLKKNEIYSSSDLKIDATLNTSNSQTTIPNSISKTDINVNDNITKVESNRKKNKKNKNKESSPPLDVKSDVKNESSTEKQNPNENQINAKNNKAAKSVKSDLQSESDLTTEEKVLKCDLNPLKTDTNSKNDTMILKNDNKSSNDANLKPNKTTSRVGEDSAKSHERPKLSKASSVCSSISDTSKISVKSDKKKQKKVLIDSQSFDRAINEAQRGLERLDSPLATSVLYQKLHSLRVLGNLLTVVAEREDVAVQIPTKTLTTVVFTMCRLFGNCQVSASYMLTTNFCVHLIKLLAGQMEKDLKSDPREMELAGHLCDCLSMCLDAVQCMGLTREEGNAALEHVTRVLRYRGHCLVSYMCLLGCFSYSEEAGKARESMQTLVTISADLCQPCDLDGPNTERVAATLCLRSALGTSLFGCREQFCMLFVKGAGLEECGEFVRAARTVHLLAALARLQGGAIVQEAFGEGGWPLEFRAAVARLLTQHAPNDKEPPKTSSRPLTQRLDQSLSETMVLDLIILVGFVVVNNPQLQEVISEGGTVVRTLCMLPANWLVSRPHCHALLPTLAALAQRRQVRRAIEAEISVEMLEEYLDSPEAQNIKLVQAIKEGRAKRQGDKK